MVAQILQLRLSGSETDAVADLISQWRRIAGMSVDGLLSAHVLRLRSEPGSITIIIDFQDQSSLAAFSRSSATLDFFSAATTLVRSEILYDEAEFDRIV